MGVWRLSVVLLFVACGGQGSPTASPTAPPKPPASVGTADAAVTASTVDAAPIAPAPTSNATLAQVGIETASLDRTADPCVDFYQFACGGWLATTPIPPDEASWSRFAELTEINRGTLTSILDGLAKTPGTKLGDYYASCMDEPAIERAGLAGIQPLLAKAQGIRDAKSWTAAVIALHKAGVGAVWTPFAAADMADATRYVTWLDPIGLGLPDRDYYLDARFADTLAAYKQHVQRMFTAAGIAKPDAAADGVLAVETALAKQMKPRAERRDPKVIYNVYDAKKLAKELGVIDWKTYWKGLGITPSKKLVVTEPRYFTALATLREQLPPAQWASYFTYQLLVDYAVALPKGIQDEAFALEKLTGGATENMSRSKRCVHSVSESLGELLGKQYVDKHLPPESKAAASALYDAIAKVLGDDLAAVDWMTDATKQTARDKLSKLVAMVGYPAKWRTYDFAVKRDDFAGDLVRARTFEAHRVLAKSGKPYDRGEWYSNTFDVDAYYNAQANNSALLAGILQPPFFGAKRSVAANLGGIGMVIGHELTHAFDDQGAQYDAQGNLHDWWAPPDKTAFEQRGQCVAAQYSTFEAQPKRFINGQLTLGENIADMGGVKMAFNAYRAQRTGAEPLVADGFSEDQVFFLAVAQAWCSKDRPESLARRLTTDPHSPPKFRVYGALRNLPEFAQAFSCAAGTPMRPTQTCTVW